MSNTSDHSTPRVAVVVSGWPRKPESFALDEPLAMRRAGILAAVCATKHADPTHQQPAVVALDDLVHHLGVVPAEEQAAEIVGVLGGLNIANINGVPGYLVEWTAPTDVPWERWSRCP